MDFLTIFYQTFDRVAEAAITGVIASIIWLIMSMKNKSILFRTILAFVFLFALTFVYATILAFGEYYGLP